MSHITSASLWEKRNETLRSEAELRRLVIPRLDSEYRGEVCVSPSAPSGMSVRVHYCVGDTFLLQAIVVCRFSMSATTGRTTHAKLVGERFSTECNLVMSISSFVAL